MEETARDTRQARGGWRGGALSLLLHGSACAQSSESSAREAQMQAALAAADAGTYDATQYPGLSASPVYGWLEYAALKRNIDTLSDAQGQAFLRRYDGQPVAQAFREVWLAALSRRQDWPAFRAAWSPSIASTSLRCAELDARQALGAADAKWVNDAQALWRASGKTLPPECASPMLVLASKGGLPPALRWERIDKAAGEWNVAAMRDAARGLPAAEATLANDYAGFVAAPNPRALQWPKTDRSRWIASQGLAKLGKANPTAAEAQLPQYANALAFTDTDRGRVLYQVALWSVASYDPASARRLAAVPDVSWDERLHEWQVREALARSDWRSALAAIQRMPAEQRGLARWQYFEARLDELAGNRAAASALYAQAAQKTEYHGFLAADRIGQPYALCAWEPQDPASAKAAVAADPSLMRALALYRVGRNGWAQREWTDALSRFDDTRRRIAVEVAQDAGWFDRGVFGLVNVAGKSHPDELRLLLLRFPLHHDAAIRREAAKNGLDPAWVAAEIRAESIFEPSARSPANALGLMQLLPGTGAMVAKKIGQPWGGADSLYDPDSNITLGTAYLRQLLDKYGQPYKVIAGYNAGPGPVNRWTSQRPSMDPDFWIETISYKETRDYVARVLAFSTIYDWRLNGDALPLDDRMTGGKGARKRFACPAGAGSS